MKYIWQGKNWHDFGYEQTILLKPLSRLRILQGKLLGMAASLDIKLEV